MKKPRSLFELLLGLTTRSWLVLLLVMVGAIAADAAPFAYVTCAGYFSSCVSVIDIATNTVVARIPTPDTFGSAGVAITPDGAFAYVAGSRDNAVSIIDTATNTVVATVPVGMNPQGVAITPF